MLAPICIRPQFRGQNRGENRTKIARPQPLLHTEQRGEVGAQRRGHAGDERDVPSHHAQVKHLFEWSRIEQI